MPVRADFAVVLDACVLVEASVADFYLRLSEEPRLLLPKWTDLIWDEVDRTCIGKLGWDPDLTKRRRLAATTNFEEALVTGYEHLTEFCKNDEKDRHVLAAAIHEKVETIVTMNLKHFQADALDPWGIIAVHPDKYLITLFEHDRGIVADKLHRLAQDRRKSVEEILGRLAWTVPRFSTHVSKELGISVHAITPSAWKV
ncbi:MAG: PIN domain-containing protein [Chthonomonas sp.]|nr:PIN domain-containing protein [Chthonomonas sp.]